VIIDNFDILDVSSRPPKTDTPLIINPNAHLSCPAAFQNFEPIAGWIAQIFKRRRRIQLSKFAQRPVRPLKFLVRVLLCLGSVLCGW
jgi:hypothetical protein